MSILDARLLFSDDQAVTSSAISTNVHQRKGLGLAPNTTENLGAPAEAYIVVLVTEACTDASSDATLEVALLSDSTANLATSPTKHVSTGAMAFATFSPKGTVLLCHPLPPGAYEEYIGVGYTVASGPLTAGKFKAFITRDPNVWRRYADGKPVSPTS